MTIDRQTVVVVIAATALGFLGDTLVYSIAQSKGGKFRLAVPKGMEAVKLLLVGAITGFAIDFAVKRVEYTLMSDAEKKLDEIAALEKEKIRAGGRKNQLPTEIIYKLVA